MSTLKTYLSNKIEERQLRNRLNQLKASRPACPTLDRVSAYMQTANVTAEEAVVCIADGISPQEAKSGQAKTPAPVQATAQAKAAPAPAAGQFQGVADVTVLKVATASYFPPADQQAAKAELARRGVAVSPDGRTITRSHQ